MLFSAVLSGLPAMAQAQDLPASSLPHDLSPMGMFQAADIVVKGVMIGLAVASVVTWTILLVKSLELWRANRRARRALALLETSNSLPQAMAALPGGNTPASRMVHSATAEMERSAPALDRAGSAGLQGRLASHLGDIVAASGRRIAGGTGLLATIGSTAPFVGLFGTVWGIMNAFIGISEAQTTNLAVVAPGIAEALLATALGLVAAIPAVVIYNIFARAIAGYRQRLSAIASSVERLASRDLDLRATLGAG